MHLQKFNLSTSQTSTMWARIIVRRLSLDWSRKLAINTSRSLVSIFSNSLSSLLQTKYFINNETCLCFAWCLLVFFVFLFFFFDATQTILRSNQPTKTCYSFPSSRHFVLINLEASLESHQIWKPKNDELLWYWLRKAFMLSLIGYASTCENSCMYAILIGCTSFPHMWKIKCIDFYKSALRNRILVILVIKRGSNFESLDEIIKCDNSSESYWAVLSCGTVYYAV